MYLGRGRRRLARSSGAVRHRGCAVSHLGRVVSHRGQPGALGLDVAGEHQLLQPAQLGPGLDAQLVTEQPVGAPVGDQCVLHPPEPGRREHVLLPRPVPQRLSRQHRLQLDQGTVGMGVGQQGVDQGLGQLTVQLFQPGDGSGGPRFITPGGQRPAPPQLPGRLRPVQCLARVPGREQLGGLGDQRGELHRVGLLARQRQPVTAGLQDQDPGGLAAAPAGFEEPAQPVQVRVQRRL